MTVYNDQTGISIHALRVEGDDPDFNIGATPSEISIHALRVEGDKTHCVPDVC